MSCDPSQTCAPAHLAPAGALAQPETPLRPRAAESTQAHNGGVPSWGSYSYAFGPLVAVAVLVVLVFILRWAFRRGESVVARPARTSDPLDYGLLVPVAEPAGAAEAEAMVAQLRETGIRGSVVSTTDGLRVMVWPADALAAHRALEGTGGSAQT